MIVAAAPVVDAGAGDGVDELMMIDRSVCQWCLINVLIAMNELYNVVKISHVTTPPLTMNKLIVLVRLSNRTNRIL